MVLTSLCCFEKVLCVLNAASLHLEHLRGSEELQLRKASSAKRPPSKASSGPRAAASLRSRVPVRKGEMLEKGAAGRDGRHEW